MTADEFRAMFKFNPEYAGKVGIERECFLTDSEGSIRPLAPLALASMNGSSSNFGYELSACQLEDRIGPCDVDQARTELQKNDQSIKKMMRTTGFGILRTEVAPESMPLDVYPDPKGRYQRITQNMPLEILRAACRVAGTHIHVGMPDAETALQVYNKVIPQLPQLIKLGDSSNGERLRIYKVMAPNFQPVPYESWKEFHSYAAEHKYDSDPRSLYHFIRISVHGTIEFRVFGAHPSSEVVAVWAKVCHNLCTQ